MLYFSYKIIYKNPVHSVDVLYNYQLTLEHEWLNPLNAELNPICHLLVLLGDLTFMSPCIVSIFQYIYPTRCNVTRFIYIWKLLFMFRVVLPPIIRSAYNCIYSKKKNSVVLVRERTIPTERPPPVGEVSANLCGLVVRVSGYRYRGPGFDSRRYQIF